MASIAWYSSPWRHLSRERKDTSLNSWGSSTSVLFNAPSWSQPNQPRNATKDRVGHISINWKRWGPVITYLFFWGGVRGNTSWCEKITVDFDVIIPVFYDELRWFMNNISYLPPPIAWLPSKVVVSCFSSTKLLLLSRSKFLSKPCAKPRHWVGGREVDGNCIQGTACCNVF